MPCTICIQSLTSIRTLARFAVLTPFVSFETSKHMNKDCTRPLSTKYFVAVNVFISKDFVKLLTIKTNGKTRRFDRASVIIK